MTVLNGEMFYQAPASFAMFDGHARGTEPTPGTAQGNWYPAQAYDTRQKVIRDGN
jgi:hypothetical protein